MGDRWRGDPRHSLVFDRDDARSVPIVAMTGTRSSATMQPHERNDGHLKLLISICSAS